MHIELALLQRWQTGWSLARGLPLPQACEGGLRVEVGMPDQLRRYLFAGTGADLRAVAARAHPPMVHIKAPVDLDSLRQALPPHWHMEQQRYLMRCLGTMRGPAMLAEGLHAAVEDEFGARLVRVRDACGETAAIGRVAVHGGCAVFDRIETAQAHRRRGLASYVMLALDAMAEQAGAHERLLVATEAGRPLYAHLGWELLAPYSTAITGPGLL